MCLETEGNDELTWIGGLTRIARHIAERDVSQTTTTSLVYKCTSPGCEVGHLNRPILLRMSRFVKNRLEQTKKPEAFYASGFFFNSFAYIGRYSPSTTSGPSGCGTDADRGPALPPLLF